MRRAAGRPRAEATAWHERLRLADGARTTLHVSVHDAAASEIRVAVLPRPRPLLEHCAAHGIADAVVGGFFVRPGGAPLGEVRTHGVARAHVPFHAPWNAVRGCLHVDGGTARIAPRDALASAPRGDLLQAGPVLVRGSEPVFDRARDREGFSAGAAQFDSDITAERHPRAAIGLGEGKLLLVACDGRAAGESGLMLEELATVMTGLGCVDALNLDGGGSTTLIAGGTLRNVPRGGFERLEAGGRAVSTALVVVPRS